MAGTSPARVGGWIVAQRRGLLALCAITLAACSSGNPSHISIRNESGAKITNGLLSGSGFSVRISDVEPDQQVTVDVIPPKGGSTVDFEFSTPQGRHSLKNLAYIETSGYLITVVIDSRFKVILSMALENPY